LLYHATLAHFESLLIAFALLNLFHKSILNDRMYEDIANVMKFRENKYSKLFESDNERIKSIPS